MRNTMFIGLQSLAMSLVILAGCSKDETGKTPTSPKANPGQVSPESNGDLPVPKVNTARAQVLVDLLAQVRKDKAFFAKVNTGSSARDLEDWWVKSQKSYQEISGKWAQLKKEGKEGFITGLTRIFLARVPMSVHQAPMGGLLSGFSGMKKNGLKQVQYWIRLNATRLQAILDKMAGKKVDEAHLKQIANKLKLTIEEEHLFMTMEIVKQPLVRMVEEQGCKVQENADMFSDRRTGVVGPGGGFLVDLLRNEMENLNTLANWMRTSYGDEGKADAPGCKAIKVVLTCHRDFSIKLADKFVVIIGEAKKLDDLRQAGKDAPGVYTSGAATILRTWLVQMEDFCLGIAPLLDKEK